MTTGTLLTDIGAVLLIVMGALFVATLFVDRLNREWHVDALLARAGSGGPIVAGAAFSIAWTPCVGPALGGVLTLAGIQGEAAHGAFLLAVYSLGLAVPFLITALAFSRATTAFAALKRHYRAIVAVGGGDPDRDGRADPHRRLHRAQRLGPGAHRRSSA